MTSAGAAIRFCVVESRLCLPAFTAALLTAAPLTACGGSSNVSTGQSGSRVASGSTHRPGYYARHALAIGRLPDGQGFGIWLQRFRFQGKGKDYVQLIASLAPASTSTEKLRKRLEEGVDGSTEDLVEDLRAPVALSGLGGCGNPPVVLLYGLIHERVGTAVLISRGRVQAFQRVAIPSELGVNGVLGYGFLTAPAILQIKSPGGATVYSQHYPGPELSRDCAGGGTPSLLYAFGNK
jgi:hypothetical protein